MSGYGNVIIVDHGGGFSTLYAHQSRLAGHQGQHVNQGDVTSESGRKFACDKDHACKLGVFTDDTLGSGVFGVPAYLICRYEDVRQVLSDPARFSSARSPFGLPAWNLIM